MPIARCKKRKPSLNASKLPSKLRQGPETGKVPRAQNTSALTPFYRELDDSSRVLGRRKTSEYPVFVSSGCKFREAHIRN
jgi:hypothetical protein